jgi:2,3-bisphosphoglycerate-dependent phosphoglycerate mutase
MGDKPTPGTLILVRCGETPWNKQGRFIGWTDVDLSDHGRKEMIHCARLLLERGYMLDISYTSLLKRAIRSSWIVKQELNQIYRPAVKSWRLNERMYGALEGLCKAELAAQLGEDKIQNWRTNAFERPPPMTPDHIYWHKNERKYANVDPKLLPITESAEDCHNRVFSLWQHEISRDLREGRNVMVSL